MAASLILCCKPQLAAHLHGIASCSDWLAVISIRVFRACSASHRAKTEAQLYEFLGVAGFLVPLCRFQSLVRGRARRSAATMGMEVAVPATATKAASCRLAYSPPQPLAGGVSRDLARRDNTPLPPLFSGG